MNDSTNTARVPLPNSAAVLVLGILSIISSCFMLGLVLGIVGLVLSREGRMLWMNDPDKYTGYGTLNAGRVLSIIGIVLASITIVYWFIALAIVGTGLGILSEILHW